MNSNDLDELLARLDALAVYVGDEGLNDDLLPIDPKVAYGKRLRRLVEAGWPEQYCGLGLRFSKGAADEDVRKAAALRVWLEGMAGRGMLAVVLGLRGTGKTMSVCKLARDFGYDRAWYFSGDGLYRERLAKLDVGAAVERGFTVGVSSRRKSLLVLDEFQRGLQYRVSGRDLSLDFFEEVINARYDAELDTVIVANWTVDDFNRFMPDSVKDRIAQRSREGRGGVRWCDWHSFRRG